MEQPPGRETLPALIRRSLAEPREALVERSNRGWKATTSAQLLDRAENIACAVRDRGLQAGDRVALIAADCVDWVAADFGILFAGCVVVPIFPTQALDQVAFILENSEAKLIFADANAVARLRQLDVSVSAPAIVFGASGAESLAAFEEHGSEIRQSAAELPEVYHRDIDPDSLAVLIYTSGTTGEPKGVMLSHYNLVFTAQSTFSHALEVITPGSDVLSVLPFSHIYEHCIIYGFMIARARHNVCHDVNDLLNDLLEVRPVAMTAVPRIFERMIAGIIAKAKHHGGLQAKAVPWALDVGRAYMTAKTRGTDPGAGLSLQYRIAHALVLKKLRPLLGLDRNRFLVSGSAPLHFDTAMTMLGADIEIVEGYGPTECSPVITANTYYDNHYGTVGRPIPGVEIKIAEDGEILARGPNVMLGYYKNPQATAEVVTDGWYHTGDIGAIDPQGFLRITDRKKELFKTSGGKFVAPSRVEAAIKRSVYVNQVMLVGDARPHPIALISPNWDLVRTELNIQAGVSVEDLAKRPAVVEFLRNQVRENTSDLAKFEQVRMVGILPRELTVEDGDLSPTLKVKRRVVEAKYQGLIDRVYAQMTAPSPA